MWNRDHKHGLKLYVQRVFIMDDAEQFMPNYLRFVRGLIDSSDLPLNVSREILQDSTVTRNLRNALTKRVLQMLEKLAKDDAEKYQTFWQQFGLVLKEGPAEDFANQEAIAKLLRFASTHTDSSAQTVSLEDYVSRMKEGQEKIYYITADSYAAAKSSPHLELLRKKGIEVLLLSDRIDEWMMNYLTEFDGKPFQSVSKVDESLEKLADEVDESAKEAEKALTPFIDRESPARRARERCPSDSPSDRYASDCLYRCGRNEHSDGETVCRSGPESAGSEIHLRTEPGSRTGETCGRY